MCNSHYQPYGVLLRNANVRHLTWYTINLINSLLTMAKLAHFPPYLSWFLSSQLIVLILSLAPQGIPIRQIERTMSLITISRWCGHDTHENGTFQWIASSAMWGLWQFWSNTVFNVVTEKPTAATSSSVGYCSLSESGGRLR